MSINYYNCIVPARLPAGVQCLPSMPTWRGLAWSRKAPWSVAPWSRALLLHSAGYLGRRCRRYLGSSASSVVVVFLIVVLAGVVVCRKPYTRPSSAASPSSFCFSSPSLLLRLPYIQYVRRVPCGASRRCLPQTTNQVSKIPGRHRGSRVSHSFESIEPGQSGPFGPPL